MRSGSAGPPFTDRESWRRRDRSVIAIACCRDRVSGSAAASVRCATTHRGVRGCIPHVCDNTPQGPQLHPAGLRSPSVRCAVTHAGVRGRIRHVWDDPRWGPRSPSLGSATASAGSAAASGRPAVTHRRVCGRHRSAVRVPTLGPVTTSASSADTHAQVCRCTTWGPRLHQVAPQISMSLS